MTKLFREIKRVKNQILGFLQSALINRKLRLLFCKLRYTVLKKNLRFHPEYAESLILKYNSSFLFSDTAFGCDGRMAMLLYPGTAFLWPDFDRKVLIIGPRTEDDIFFARALGMKNVTGLDIFSYSPHILVADAHETALPSSSFDFIAAGWVLPYTPNPKALVTEMYRLLKPGGALGFSWLEVNDDKLLIKDKNRANTLNNKELILKILVRENTKKIMDLTTTVSNGQNHAVLIQKTI
ncbi:MAG: methyltransferase domain-containing protein [Verrucomicrobia bacterium]|nr:methyltransferase domain-containing protein [Verrucomicrobiota bacterium]